MSKYRLYISLGFWSISLILQLLLPENFMLLHVGIMLLALTAMLFFRTGVNFLILLGISLIYGFALTAYAMADQIFDQQQYILMLAHLLLTATLLSLWLILHDSKTLFEENKMLKEKVRLLVKFDDQTKALSFPEFIDRGLIIETGMRRRNETGQLLYFKMMEHVPKSAKKPLCIELITYGLESIRSEYDLITSPSEGEVIILLQNTSEAGSEVVLHRIQDKLKTTINYIDLPFTIEKIVIGNLEAALDRCLQKKGA
ncbi:hypothetical protein ACM26V_15440 [Salipaludibacillus sp. HK11]|uniref:hypothetical protein n=1 Tax=Salipaludibacillus sp. HK11 TaxID=3394320 RepID=UPI0039FD686B